MATAASSYYSQDDRPLSGEAGVGRSGSTGSNLRGITAGAGLASGGSSVVYEGENEHEEHHIRQGLLPTSQGPPVANTTDSSHHPESGPQHTTGLVGNTMSRSNDEAPPAHEEYTARDEGLEPYSAPPNHPASSGYLPEKKLGPAAETAPTQAAGETAPTNEAEQPTSSHHGAGAATGAGLAGLGAGALAHNNRHNDDDDVERTRGDRDANQNDNVFLAAPTGTNGAHRDSHDGGDHTDTEAADMQPSQSYINRQSMYSQPPSTAREHRMEPLTQQKTGQSFTGGQDLAQQRTGGTQRTSGGNDEVPYNSTDYALQHGTLETAGHGTVHPVDGVEQGDADLDRRHSYAPSGRSKYTQAGMAGVGAGTLGGGASAVGTGHPDTASFVQEPYGQQQMQQPIGGQYGQQGLVQPQYNEHLPENQQHQQQYGLQPAAFAAQPGAQHGLQGFQQQQQPQLTEHQPEQDQQLDDTAGPTTGVQPIAAQPETSQQQETPGSPTSTAAKRQSQKQIGGGGLAAAITTSGRDLNRSDKKSLKREIKNEQKFEKSLKAEAKKEGAEIEMAMKMSKESHKKAEKSGRYEANFRRTHEKAIKKEVRAKQHLLKITNEYNKIAADLERANKEMEMRKNAHTAATQTRDADREKVDELRRSKGHHDMDREARHGESVVKQNQAKRALSTSRKSGIFS